MASQTSAEDFESGAPGKRARHDSNDDEQEKIHTGSMEIVFDLEECEPCEEEDDRERRFPAVRGNWPVHVLLQGLIRLICVFSFFKDYGQSQKELSFKLRVTRKSGGSFQCASRVVYANTAVLVSACAVCVLCDCVYVLYVLYVLCDCVCAVTVCAFDCAVCLFFALQAAQASPAAVPRHSIHVSLSRTCVIQHHQISPLADRLRRTLTALHP